MSETAVPSRTLVMLPSEDSKDVVMGSFEFGGCGNGFFHPLTRSSSTESGLSR